MNILARFICAAVTAMSSAAVLACGVCIDDKVAATYDHALVATALARRQVVVYAEVKGAGEAGARTRTALTAAAKVRGIDARTLRASREPATISFALDEDVANPAAALAAVQRHASGTRIELLKVLR